MVKTNKKNPIIYINLIKLIINRSMTHHLSISNNNIYLILLNIYYTHASLSLQCTSWMLPRANRKASKDLNYFNFLFTSIFNFFFNLFTFIMFHVQVYISTFFKFCVFLFNLLILVVQRI